MAFICTLDRSSPIQVQVLTGDGEYIVRLAIGYDDQSQEVVSALIILSLLPGYGDGTGYELVFSLIVSAADESHISEYWNGHDTRQVIPARADRLLAFDAVRAATERLIDEVRPAAVQMTTHTENLPDRALRKFHQIASLFENRGYDIGAPDPFHGRWMWMMRRR